MRCQHSKVLLWINFLKKVVHRPKKLSTTDIYGITTKVRKWKKCRETLFNRGPRVFFRRARKDFKMFKFYGIYQNVSWQLADFLLIRSQNWNQKLSCWCVSNCALRRFNKGYVLTKTTVICTIFWLIVVNVTRISVS